MIISKRNVLICSTLGAPDLCPPRLVTAYSPFSITRYSSAHLSCFQEALFIAEMHEIEVDGPAKAGCDRTVAEDGSALVPSRLNALSDFV